MNPEIEGLRPLHRQAVEESRRTTPLPSPPTPLNWEPLDADTNSVAAIAAHMCGVVRWWVGQGLTGKDVGRQRDTEFVARVDSNGEIDFWGTRRTIAAVISETRTLSSDILANLDPASLTEQSAVDTLGPQLNRWALVHTIDELSQHIGHMELTIQLWNTRA